MTTRIGVEELENRNEIIRELINGEEATVLNHQDLMRPSWTLELTVPKKWLVILDVPENKMDDVELYLTENTFEARKPYHADPEVIDLPPHTILAVRKPCRYSDNEIKALAERYEYVNIDSFVAGFKAALDLTL